MGPIFKIISYTRRFKWWYIGMGIFIITVSFSVSVNSCMTIASAPGGTGAPVKIRAAVPASSALPTDPAGIRWATLNFEFKEERSARRIAYPSMALLSIGGTSMVELCACASTRPVAARVGSCSISATGLAPASSVSSAWSTERRPLITRASGGRG